MSQRDNILQELADLKSTLATVTPQNIYTVPAGYFEGLAAQMLNRIKAIGAANSVKELSYLSPILSSITKQMPYAVPVGYFESLENKLMQHVRDSHDYQTAEEELATLSPLLSGLKKQIPYTVPQGYFESLPVGVQEPVSKLSVTEKISAQENKPVAKVISMTKRKWLRYAAAAVVTGMIFIAGFLVLGGGEKEPGGKALAKLTRDVNKMDEAQKDKLIDFIDAGMNGEETVKVKSDEVKTLLQGISEEELKDFQEQTEDIQDVLMTN